MEVSCIDDDKEEVEKNVKKIYIYTYRRTRVIINEEKIKKINK